MKKSYIIVLLCIIFLLSLFIFQKINLTTADLGRHLVNGKLLLHPENFNTILDPLLNTNFFSFTNPDYPFVNHHFGSGILFYLIFSVFGFFGLSLFYGVCIIFSTIILFHLFHTGRDKIPLFISFPIILFLIPLIGERTEVRPEGLSYVFISIILTLLYLYQNEQIQKKWLYFIPLIAFFFVNTHIYFIFVPFIIGMFLLENLIYRNFIKFKNLAVTFGLSVLMLSINPHGPTVLIYPFTIWQNYGYLVVENQSIAFLANLGINNPNFLWWKIATIIFIATSFFILSKHRKSFPLALVAISTAFSILSFFSIRHLTLYGLSLVPLFLYYAYILYKKPEKNDKEKLETHVIWSVSFSIIIFIAILINFNNRLFADNSGMGLLPKINSSIEFWKKENLEGPIFSNYDIGGYLIFHLHDKEKVFVDNRPEAYPKSFLQNEYIPMQENDTVWKQEMQKWNFNAIYFYRHDMTPWAQKFLVTRISDPLWAPVFVDDYTIIFLERNSKNNAIIEKYELPKSMFSIK